MNKIDDTPGLNSLAEELEALSLRLEIEDAELIASMSPRAVEKELKKLGLTPGQSISNSSYNREKSSEAESEVARRKNLITKQLIDQEASVRLAASWKAEESYPAPKTKAETRTAKQPFGSFGGFALACSGANRKVLEYLKEQGIDEESRQIMIGMFVFLTAVFASFSGGYALYTGFKSLWLAVLVGLLWGVFIFNIDRFIISTIRKRLIDPNWPRRKRWTLIIGGYASVIPRLTLAIMISIVISTPLMLKYFEPEIRVRIDQDLYGQAIEVRSDALQNQPEVNQLKEENNKLSEAITDKEKLRDQLRSQAFSEAEGTGGTMRVGRGIVFNEKLQEYEKYQKELEEFRQNSLSKIRDNNERISSFEARSDEQIKKLLYAMENGKGFLANLQALDKLATEHKTIWWARLFISLLILVLECTPILMKVLLPYGSYDGVLEAREYKDHLVQMATRREHEEKVDKAIAFEINKTKATFEIENQLIKETMQKFMNSSQPEIEEAKAVVGKKLIENWKEKILSV